MTTEEARAYLDGLKERTPTGLVQKLVEEGFDFIEVLYLLNGACMGFLGSTMIHIGVEMDVDKMNELTQLAMLAVDGKNETMALTVTAFLNAANQLIATMLVQQKAMAGDPSEVDRVLKWFVEQAGGHKH